MNMDKTTLFFSGLVDEGSRQIIKDILGVLEEYNHEKYLGLPSLIGRRKKASFNYIKEGCGESCKGGKENSYHKREGRF